MRRLLIATTALIALAAILVLGIPLGLVESARARGDALGRLEREADGIAAAVDDRSGGTQRLDARALTPWLRPGHAAVVSARSTVVRVGRMPAGSIASSDGDSFSIFPSRSGRLAPQHDRQIIRRHGDDLLQPQPL